MTRDERGHVIVMAKPAIPGHVKTRLIGVLTASQAAAVHAAMLQCVLDRVSHWIRHRSWSGVMAIDDSLPRDGSRPPDDQLDLSIPPGWEVRAQGQGDLGERLGRVWQALGGGAVVFLGVDSPDVPIENYDQAIDALKHGDAAIGPAVDGGYWTLTGRRFDQRLVSEIDWGTAAVYDQTLRAAREAGLCVVALPIWHDVDTPGDLDALRRRIERRDDPALQRLKARLDVVCKDLKL